MIRLSMNVLSSARVFLNYIENYKFLTLSDLAYSRIASINAEDIFAFSYGCGWISENENVLTLTERGVELLCLQKQGMETDLKRQMLMDYLLKFAPIWSSRIPFGRRETAIFMSKDERACFVDAGLLSDHIDSGVVNWWDTIAIRIKIQTQRARNETGRLGEQNTMEYEKERTEANPMWMSIDSNLVGYDIKSQVSKENPEVLLIEVKTSTCALRQAAFHVTSHEWNVALSSGAYVFHLWCLSGNKKKLAIVSPSEIRPYIPTNNLDGQWESAIVPFSCFEDKFVEIA